MARCSQLTLPPCVARSSDLPTSMHCKHIAYSFTHPYALYSMVPSKVHPCIPLHMVVHTFVYYTRWCRRRRTHVLPNRVGRVEHDSEHAADLLVSSQDPFRQIIMHSSVRMGWRHRMVTSQKMYFDRNPFRSIPLVLDQIRQRHRRRLILQYSDRNPFRLIQDTQRPHRKGIPGIRSS